jgi:type I restriction enzyme S subunit
MFVRKASDDWRDVKVEDVAQDIRTGPFGSQLLHSEFTDNGISVLGIDNAVANEFRWSQRRYISEEKYKTLRRYTVRPGDVLITIMGTCGRCAIVPQDIPVAINTKHLCCTTLDQQKCLPEFLHAVFLNDPGVRKQLGVQAKGAIMPGLNMGIIKSLRFRLPPVSTQQLFSNRITNIRRAAALAARQLNKFEEIFYSIQKRAFSDQI